MFQIKLLLFLLLLLFYKTAAMQGLETAIYTLSVRRPQLQMPTYREKEKKW